MTPAERESVIESVREELANAGWPEDEIDDAVSREFERSDEPPMTFRDTDVLSLFPEIPTTDQLLYSCSVSLLSPPLQTYVYFSAPAVSERSFEAKKLACDVEQSGMYCDLSRETALFLDSAEEFFFIDGTIGEDEARQVAAMYREEMGSPSGLNRISKRGDEYVLRIGRDGCACWGDRTAKIRTFLFWSWLQIAETGSDTCI